MNEVIEPTANDNQKTKEMIDAFTNALARLGANTSSLLEATQYTLSRLTRDYVLLTSLYRSHWIIRKIIDTRPEDAMKNWISLTCQLTPEAIDQFNKVVRKTKVKEMLLKGLKWGKLYGGAAGIILIEGHEDYLDQPLNLDTVLPDSFKGLLILDRWSGIAPTADTIDDINDPDFDLPKYYQVTITGNGGKCIKVHHSRVIRFTGRDLPYWERWAENNWGISDIEVMFEELKKRDNTSWNIANLIFTANLKIQKMGNLRSALATMNSQAQQALYNTLSAQNQIMSNQGVLVLDKEDDFDTKQYTFTGMAEMYKEFKEDICGSTGYPMTKLFGSTPGGLNTDGESGLQNYDDTVQEEQETYIRPALDKLLPVICHSMWGMIPDDFDYKFNPVRTLPYEKLADISSKFTDTIINAFNAGLTSQKTSLKELRQMSEITGVFSNITDEDINKADEEVKESLDLPFGEFDNEKEIEPDKADTDRSIRG